MSLPVVTRPAAAAEIETAYRWYEKERAGLGSEFLETVNKIYPACDALKMPRGSRHMFRHLHGTLLSQLGVLVALAQAQLGQADPRITLAIYTHVMPDAQRDAVMRLERFL